MKIQISVSAVNFSGVDAAFIKCATRVRDYATRKNTPVAVFAEYQVFLKRILFSALCSVVGDRALFVVEKDVDANGMKPGRDGISGSVAYIFHKANLKIVVSTVISGRQEGLAEVIADVSSLDGSVAYGRPSFHVDLTDIESSVEFSGLIGDIGALVKKNTGK